MESNPAENTPKKKKSFLRRLFRFIFRSFLVLLLLLIGAVTLAFIYEDEVKGIIIKELNKNLNAEVKINPKDIDLTIIRSFPMCALEFKNLTCMEAVKKKQKDTLLFASFLQLKFDLKDLWNKKYEIKKINLSQAFVRMHINKKGEPNYLIWKSSQTQSSQNDSLQFKLENVSLENVFINYQQETANFNMNLLAKNISLSGAFTEESYALNGKGNLLVNQIQQNNIALLKNKQLLISAALDVKNNHYNIRQAEIKLNEMSFDTQGEMIYADNLEKLNLNFEAKKLNIRSVLSLLHQNQTGKLKDYESDGELYAKGHVRYEKNWDAAFEFGFNNTNITYVPEKTSVNNVNLSGNFLWNKNQSYLHLKNIHAELMGDELEGDFEVNDFNAPGIFLNAKGKLSLENFIKFWPLDTIKHLSGNIILNTLVEGKLAELQKNTLSEKNKLELDASIERFAIQFKKQTDTSHIQNCELSAHDRVLKIQNLQIRKGNSDATINGKVEGFFNYLSNGKSPLKISGEMKSEKLRGEDFLIASNNNSSNENSEVDLPEHIHFYLDAAIGSFEMGKFKARNLSGNIELKNKKVMAEALKMETMEGSAEIDALFDFSGKQLEVSSLCKLQNINVSSLFYQMNNFGQQTLEDKHIGGFLTAQIDFNGNWNKKLEPELSSIKSQIEISIENGVLKNFKPLESLSKFVDLKELQNIRFETLKSTVEIKKSVISIPKTAIKNSALNIDFWGSHTFNNDIDYHIQLLISELLAKKRRSKNEDEFGPIENDPDNRRSAFILMTGTVDKPIIKYDKKGLKQKIKEDIKQEKQTLKQLLKEEFGLFKKDSIKTKQAEKSNQVFKLEGKEEKDTKKKRKEEDEDDF